MASATKALELSHADITDLLADPNISSSSVLFFVIHGLPTVALRCFKGNSNTLQRIA